MKSKKKIPGLIAFILMLILELNLSASTPDNQTITQEMRSELDALKAFLINQITPNLIVPEPAPGRNDLVVSYVHEKSTPGYAYVHSRTAVYDNAAAIIALVMLNERDKAVSIIESLMGNMRADGDLWFIMNTHNYWPNESDNKGAMIRTGSSSWVGYAVCYFILTEQFLGISERDNSKTAEFLTFAETIADAVLRRQITDRKDFRYGLITGGDRTIAMKNIDGKIVEQIVNKPIEWISIEHNIDSYFFLRDLAYLSGKDKYKSAAKILKKGILNTYNYHLGHFERGFNAKGPDPYRALDCASWGTMFLLAAKQEKLALSTTKSLNDFKNSINGLIGFKPYIDTTIYEDEDAQKFYYRDAPEKRWNDIHFLWSEGSFGAALAYIRMGKQNQAKEIIQSFIGPEMNVNGGIRYADKIIEHQFTNAPSAIGSAWAVIAIKNLENDKLASLFWCEDLPRR